jgi:hypothetical protein
MSEADQFREYAEEALRWPAKPKSKKRSAPCLSLRAHGRKRRLRASGLWW